MYIESANQGCPSKSYILPLYHIHCDIAFQTFSTHESVKKPIVEGFISMDEHTLQSSGESMGVLVSWKLRAGLQREAQWDGQDSPPGQRRRKEKKSDTPLPSTPAQTN